VTRVLAAAGLLAVWLLLWGEATVANLASGLVVVGLVVAADARLRRAPQHRIHPLRVAVLAGDLAVRLVVASGAVVVTVLRPTPARLRSGVVRVPLRSRSELVTTLVADLISLTPGTLTLDARDGALFVHVLGLGDADEVRADVAAIERRVLAAFTPIDRDGRGTR
jgi:multicomponent Na+:H+ antiporter subunit E